MGPGRESTSAEGASSGPAGEAGCRRLAAALGDVFGADVSPVAGEVHPESRGRLSVVDIPGLGIEVRRMFTVTDVPTGTRRGGHSHAKDTQVLFCVAGRIDVELRQGDTSRVVTLLPDGAGLRITGGVWASQHYVEPHSALLVLASLPYDPAGYRTDPAAEA